MLEVTVQTGAKTWKSISDQIDILEKRGLEVGHGFADFLHQNNYYRVSGYSRFLLKKPAESSPKFVQNAHSSTIVAAYLADAELRQMLWSVLSGLEILIRAKWAHIASRRLQEPDLWREADFYTNPGRQNADGQSQKERLLAGIKRDVQKSQELFIKHHINNGRPLPLWVAVEALTFTNVSLMIGIWPRNSDVKSLADELGVPESYLSKAIQSLSVLRNTVAHHGRLWNRVLELPVPLTPEITKIHGKVNTRTPAAWVLLATTLGETLLGMDGVVNSALETMKSPAIERGYYQPDKYKQ